MLLPVKNVGTYSIMKTCAQTTHPTIQWSKKKLIFNTTDTQICAYIPPERSSITLSTSLSCALSFFTNSFLLSFFYRHCQHFYSWQHYLQWHYYSCNLYDGINILLVEDMAQVTGQPTGMSEKINWNNKKKKRSKEIVWVQFILFHFLV